MRLDHVAAGNPPTEFTETIDSAQTGESDFSPENQLENRIKNLDRLAESIHSALGWESFSGKPHALDLADDLRLKVRASWNMFRVAKLLSEPARASMLSKVRASISDLEDVVASHFGVEMT